MEQEIMNSLLSPVIQYGFAGMTVIMTGVVVWLIRNLLMVLKDNGKIIEQNTSAIVNVGLCANKSLETMEDLKEKMLARPCIAKYEGRKD